jgi:hypothetical protein
MRKCLAAITGTDEYQARRLLLPEKHRASITEADRFLRRNEQLFQQLRNEFGGHIHENVEDQAISAMECGSIGKIIWAEDEIGDQPWLQLHFAHDTLLMAIRQRLKPGVDFETELQAAFEVLARAQWLIHDATFALVHEFIWDSFG